MSAFLTVPLVSSAVVLIGLLVGLRGFFPLVATAIGAALIWVLVV